MTSAPHLNRPRTARGLLMNESSRLVRPRDTESATVRLNSGVYNELSVQGKALMRSFKLKHVSPKPISYSAAENKLESPLYFTSAAQPHIRLERAGPERPYPEIPIHSVRLSPLRL